MHIFNLTSFSQKKIMFVLFVRALSNGESVVTDEATLCIPKTKQLVSNTFHIIVIWFWFLFLGFIQFWASRSLPLYYMKYWNLLFFLFIILPYFIFTDAYFFLNRLFYLSIVIVQFTILQASLIALILNNSK